MKDSHPPKYALRFLQWFCPDHLYEEIEGDLIQKFQRDVKEFGERSAKRKLAWNTIRFFRPGIILRNKFSIQQNELHMFQSYYKIGIRNLMKRKLYSFINIAGLALGMTAFFLINLYVWNERSYEDFHVNKDRLFRVTHQWFTNGEPDGHDATSPAIIGPDLRANFPEVLRYVRLFKSSGVLANKDILFEEERTLFASEDFFTVFSFPLIKGVDSLVLREPFTMVVSESLAARYFGKEDPIGKTLRKNGREDYEIVGVFKDVPENSHLKFDALFSFSSYIRTSSPEDIEDMNFWWQDNFYSYILLDTQDPADFESKLPAFIDKKVGKELTSENMSMAFVLQPITGIHLYSDLHGELEPNGDGGSNNFLVLVAAFILIMAWINYINLATAKSVERAREVGIRKVMGSIRGQLVGQFLVESFIISFVAILFTTLIVTLVLPHYATFVDRKFDLSIFKSTDVWMLASAIFLLGVICAGVYPAFVMSGFKPVSVLKGKFQTSSNGIYLRKGLVVAQFASSIILITGTFAVYRQIEFMRSSALGVDIEQVLTVHGPAVRDSAYVNRFITFRNELLEYPEISAVTTSASVPGRGPTVSSGGIHQVSQDNTHGNSYRIVVTDNNFIYVFGLQLITGRNFSEDFDDEGKSVVVNETAMKLLGFTDPQKIIGEEITLWGRRKVIGVVKDYHQESLKKKVDQLIFEWNQQVGIYFSVKIKTKGPMQATLTKVEGKFKKSFPGNPFRHFFMDDYYNQQYQSDLQFGNVFGLFTVIAIVIACLGLFGLSSYSVVQRAKEISIRKVIGASVKQITVLVSKEFVLIVLSANIIAWPIAYFLMDRWLSDFAFRINLGLLSFLIPGAIALMIAIFTVASQSIKAAAADPVKSLRSE